MLRAPSLRLSPLNNLSQVRSTTFVAHTVSRNGGSKLCASTTAERFVARSYTPLFSKIQSQSTSRAFSKKKKKGAEEEEVEVKETKAERKERLSQASSSSSSNADLEATIRAIENSFGKGTVLKLGDEAKNRNNIQVIPTGSLGVDLALGVGGLPRGKIAEIYGPESSGKTTLALNVIAQAHKMGGKCTFIDAEHALDPIWARKIGVKIDELLVCQPDSGEQALEIADTLVQDGKMDVIVIDSVAALVPKAELEGNMGDHHVGAQARLMSQALRKLTGSLGKQNKTVLIFINQIRNKIGVMFGNPETTTGGTALKYYCSARLDIRKTGSIKVGEHIVGSTIKVKVAKNKMAPPYKEAHFDIDFGKGISKAGELVDLGVKAKLLDKSGAWYAYEGEKVGQGREKTKIYFETHHEAAQKLEDEIRAKLLSGEFGYDVEEAAADAELEDEK